MIACSAVLFWATGGLGQCPVDPFDVVLCVYTLTAQEEEQFSNTDGQVSAFWSSWSGRDEIELLAPDDCYPGRCNFTGTGDAAIIMRAAGTGRGLYLYMAVEDNVWVDRASETQIGADATDVFFDKMDANSIFTCTDCYVGLYSTTLTFSSNQFQVWMGSATPPATFNYQEYDDALWSWTENKLTWANAEIIYGFKAEVVTVDPTHKVQEWFYPWEKFGKGIPVGTELGNMKVAFTGGYNDMDGDNPTNDCLRWTTKDPWASDAQEVNYWGDLQLAADMGTVEQVLPTAVKVRPARAMPVRGVSRTDFYSLRGRRVPAERVARMPGSGILVKRNVFADGSAEAGLLRVTE
jgi:hypothetical protein